MSGKVLGLLAAVVVVVLLGLQLMTSTQSVRPHTPLPEAARKLKTLVLAMQWYEYGNGSCTLPPPAVYGPGGTPLLSWRVLLLPALGHEDLFRRFNLNEPWDSQHNLQLLPEMPPEYAPPERKSAADYTTYCQVFVGPGAAFERSRRLRLPGDFPDGMSQTILVVEGGQAVPWTKPADLSYQPDGPLPKLGGRSPNGFYAAFADGGVFFIERKTTEKTLRALVTRNGRENPGPDW
jgi:hypothetical protein